MLYLLDANTLIDANRDYYPIEKVDEYWSWLLHQAEAGRVKMAREIYDEVAGSADVLGAWCRSDDCRNALVIDEAVDVGLVQRVIDEGYAPDLDDVEIGRLGRDPFLIACALADPAGRTIVSTEKSAPSKRRANRKVPDVCAGFDIACCHSFTFNRLLDFSTNWATRVGG